ncbi:MAG TPA: cupredoxin family copper-binding protein [Casimicrobiaceae bacterium]
MRRPLAIARPRPLARAASIAWLALVALSPLAAIAQPTVTIDIRSFTFTPKEVTVAPGTHVVWTNRDDTPHTVTATDHGFASPGLDTGDTFEHTFGAEGDYAYLCTVHPYMTGVVHVRKP